MNSLGGLWKEFEGKTTPRESDHLVDAFRTALRDLGQSFHELHVASWSSFVGGYSDMGDGLLLMNTLTEWTASGFPMIEGVAVG